MKTIGKQSKNEDILGNLEIPAGKYREFGHPTESVAFAKFIFTSSALTELTTN